MLLNKSIYSLILIVSLLSFSYIFAQSPLWFWDSVPQTEVVGVVISTNWNSSSVIYPSSLAGEAIRIHFNHYNLFPQWTQWVLALTRSIQLSITTDIIVLLEQALDKTAIVDTYLLSVTDLLDRAISQRGQFTLRLSSYTDSMNSCLVDKNLADTHFFTALQDNNDDEASRALDASLLASRCATDNRVNANATQAQLDKLDFYTIILQKKYDYISLKRDSIQNYFAVLKPELLRDLTAIAAELQSYVMTK